MFTAFDLPSWIQPSLAGLLMFMVSLPSDKSLGYFQVLLPEQEKSRTLGVVTSTVRYSHWRVRFSQWRFPVELPSFDLKERL